ncbi:MAG: 6-phosphogluconolactonase [Pyrinomonadaceae bacterium]|nr:6-phosphogluconolactonase [Pyrinomonadaceae bacterium]
MKEIKTFENVEKINKFAAEKFVEIAKDSIEKRGRFTVALSGGSTPKKLYALLATEPFRSQIEWQKVQFFFGDERFVPKDSDESNFRMANEALFSKVEIPAENIHRFLTENGDAKTVAELMEREIRDVFKLKENEFPNFDLVFLGMGADGHTASLFPETAALKENQRIVTENYVPKFETFRLTFTFPTINHARNIIFLIAGADKTETLHEVLHGEFQPEKLPSQAVKPINGNLLILTDIK